MYLGSNPTEDISNKFTFTEGKATLSQYIYDEDIYVSIDVGEEITNVPVSFASSSMKQEHNFPAMANLSIVDGIATKTCVVCHKGTKQAICENEITTLGSHSYVNSNGLVQIPVKFDHPVRLDLKLPNGKVYCQVFDKETKNSLNYYVVDGEEIIVLDGEKDNNIEVNFSEFTLLNEGDSVNLINGSAVFKMKRPETETKILDLDEDKYYSHFYSGNKYKSYCSTEQIDDEYIYCYVGTDDDSLLSSSITARFKDHTHVFTNNKCTCGLSNRFEVYGNTSNYLVVGLNEIYLYNNIISGSKVTIETNSNDLIEIFDKDSGELITKGYRTVTYVRPTSKTYICKINNTEINKSFSVREIA